MSLPVSASIDHYVGMAISARRKELDLSPVELAYLVHIDIVRLTQLEIGTARPEPQLLLALADILNVQISYFFTSVANTRVEQKSADRISSSASLVASPV